MPANLARRLSSNLHTASATALPIQYVLLGHFGGPRDTPSIREALRGYLQYLDVKFCQAVLFEASKSCELKVGIVENQSDIPFSLLESKEYIWARDIAKFLQVSTNGGQVRSTGADKCSPLPRLDPQFNSSYRNVTRYSPLSRSLTLQARMRHW